MKTCLKCKKEKDYAQYSKRTKSKDGLSDWCLSFVKENNLKNKEKRKKYNEENKEKIKEYNSIYSKQHYENNKFYYELYRKKYNEENKEKIKEYNKNTLEYRKKWAQNQYKINPNFKLSQLLRIRLLDALQNKNNKTESVLILLACSIEEFKIHLEKQFTPEMNWDNHGEVWEIDHIKPCAMFDLTDHNQQKECFHYSNHQPLFKTTEIAESFGYKNYIGNRDKFTKTWKST